MDFLVIFLDFSVNFGQSQPGLKGARLLVSNIDQQACNSNDPMMLLLCVRLVRKATLKVPKDKTGATQIFQILINRTTTWLDFMEVEEKRRQV